MKVELSLHATKLKNVAGAFKGTSDPFAVVTLMGTQPGEKPRVLGKTEVIKNSLSPAWVTSFVLDYEMGTPCKVAVNLFDEVRKGDNKGMGSAVFEIGEVLGKYSDLGFLLLMTIIYDYNRIEICQISQNHQPSFYSPYNPLQEPEVIPRPRK